MRLNKPEILYPGRAVAMTCKECGSVARIMRYPHKTVSVKSSVLIAIVVGLFSAAITAILIHG